jgi:hypothetical protein
METTCLPAGVVDRSPDAHFHGVAGKSGLLSSARTWSRERAKEEIEKKRRVKMIFFID